MPCHADLAAYFMITGRNLALDHERRRKIAPFCGRIEGLDPFVIPHHLRKQLPSAAGKPRLRVQAALEHMPARAQQVFILARIDGLTYVEIGERLGISPKTVFGHMVVALERLRAEVNYER